MSNIGLGIVKRSIPPWLLLCKMISWSLGRLWTHWLSQECFDFNFLTSTLISVMPGLTWNKDIPRSCTWWMSFQLTNEIAQIKISLRLANRLEMYVHVHLGWYKTVDQQTTEPLEPIEPAKPLTFRKKKKKGNLNAVRNLVFWYKKITLIGNFLLRPCPTRND